MESNGNERRTRRHYDQQFKEDAVNLVISSGKSINEVAAELGVQRSNLGRWKRELLDRWDQNSGTNAEGMKHSEVEAELRKLRAELREMTEQRDILKKALSVFAQPPRRGTNS